ncbi:MAG: S8 family serine peptidase [Phycisphaeraceae bacterium]|nr:S8 family serine peptidase [Phycisphaeraceae bacterium]MCB9847390.1 S8 family serine peptidase [Phycisphaeraceae bacterium]
MNPTRTHARCALAVRLLLVWPPMAFCVTAIADDAPAPQPDERFYHVFDGKRLPLELDTSRFAVLADDAAARSLGASQSIPIPGWKLIATGPDERTNEALCSALAEQSVRDDLGFVSPVFIGDDGGPVIVTPTLLIRIDPAIPEADAERLIAGRFAGPILERDWANMKGAYRVRAESRSGLSVLDAANDLAQTPGVLWAEPDMIFTGRGGLLPNDPFFNQCWGLRNTGQSGGAAGFDMDAPDAWDLTTGDPSIIVAVLDVGVDPTHPDLNQVVGADFTSDPDLNGAPVNQCDLHGTAVAGCVTGAINNNLGAVGIAPDCRIASARPFISNVPCDGGWTSAASWTVNALAWAESIGARVSNNSNGYGFTSSSIANMYVSTRNNGMVHFASAGNNASSTVTYPSSLTTVNCVLALNRFGNRANFSNWGIGSAFSAPGEAILTTDRQGSAGYVSGDYVVVDGTSFASPYTAGVAALVLSVDPSLTAAEVEQALVDGAEDLNAPGYDTDSGWGLVNARASIDRAPGDFAITDPGCGAGFGGATIRWEASLLVDTYTVEIATDPLYTNVVHTQSGIAATQHTVPPGVLAPCADYYVRVTAVNPFGTTTDSSSPCAFTFAPSADLNADGAVDTADLGGLIGSFGNTGPFGDINGDATVDTADLGILLNQFGVSCSGP